VAKITPVRFFDEQMITIEYILIHAMIEKCPNVFKKEFLKIDLGHIGV
jgi:hypothetical protein